MITLLYIYFIFNLVYSIAMYFVSYSDVWDKIITRIKKMSNESLSSAARKNVGNKSVVAAVIIILMILFL